METEHLNHDCSTLSNLAINPDMTNDLLLDSEIRNNNTRTILESVCQDFENLDVLAARQSRLALLKKWKSPENFSEYSTDGSEISNLTVERKVECAPAEDIFISDTGSSPTDSYQNAVIDENSISSQVTTVLEVSSSDSQNQTSDNIGNSVKDSRTEMVPAQDPSKVGILSDNFTNEKNISSSLAELADAEIVQTSENAVSIIISNPRFIQVLNCKDSGVPSDTSNVTLNSSCIVSEKENLNEVIVDGSAPVSDYTLHEDNIEKDLHTEVANEIIYSEGEEMYNFAHTYTTLNTYSREKNKPYYRSRADLGKVAATRARRITAKMKAEWTRVLEEKGFLVCPLSGCFQKYRTMANFQTHYKYCYSGMEKDLKHCPYCASVIFSSHKAVLHHMKVEHPEKLDEYKTNFPQPEDVYNCFEDESRLVEISQKSLKIHKRKFNIAKENRLSPKKRILKNKIKTIRQPDIENSQLRECGRFDEIVSKISSVNKTQSAERDENKLTKERRKRKLILTGHVVTAEKYFEDERDDDAPNDMPVEKEAEEKEKIYTKSRLVLNMDRYKRYTQYLTVTRDFGSHRKTYSRPKSSHVLDSSQLLTVQNDSSELDIHQLNSSFETSNISLNENDTLCLANNNNNSDLCCVPPEISAFDPLQSEAVILNKIHLDSKMKRNSIVNYETERDSNCLNSNESNEPAKEKIPCYRPQISAISSPRIEPVSSRKPSLKISPIITYGKIPDSITALKSNRPPTVDFDSLVKNSACNKKLISTGNIQLPSVEKSKYNKEDGIKHPYHSTSSVAPFKRKRGRPRKDSILGERPLLCNNLENNKISGSLYTYSNLRTLEKSGNLKKVKDKTSSEKNRNIAPNSKVAVNKLSSKMHSKLLQKRRIKISAKSSLKKAIMCGVKRNRRGDMLKREKKRGRPPRVCIKSLFKNSKLENKQKKDRESMHISSLKNSNTDHNYFASLIKICINQERSLSNSVNVRKEQPNETQDVIEQKESKCSISHLSSKEVEFSEILPQEVIISSTVTEKEAILSSPSPIQYVENISTTQSEKNSVSSLIAREQNIAQYLPKAPEQPIISLHSETADFSVSSHPPTNDKNVFHEKDSPPVVIKRSRGRPRKSATPQQEKKVEDLLKGTEKSLVNQISSASFPGVRKSERVRKRKLGSDEIEHRSIEKEKVYAEQFEKTGRRGRPRKYPRLDRDENSNSELKTSDTNLLEKQRNASPLPLKDKRTEISDTPCNTARGRRGRPRLERIEPEVSEITRSGQEVSKSTILEPEIGKSTISEPEIGKSTVSEPEISKSIISEPEVSKSTISEPEISKSTISGPEVSEITRSEPEVSEITRSEPEVSEITRSKPEVSEITRSKPEVSEITRSKPEVSEITRSKPEVSEITRSKPEGSEITRSKPEVSEITRSEPEVSEITRSEPKGSEITRSEAEVSKSTRSKPDINEITRSEAEVSKSTTSEPEICESTISEPEICKSTISEPEICKSTISEPEICKSTISEPEISKSTISEPEISKSIISEPEISKSIISEPEISKSIISEPEISKSIISESEVSKSAVSEPEVSKSIISESEVSKSAVSEPEVSKSIISEPEVSKSIISEPEVSKSIISEPEVSKSIISEPEVSKSIISEPEVRKSIISESEVRKSIISESEVRKSIISEPEVRKSIISEPEVRKSIISEPEVRKSIISEPEVRKSIISEPEISKNTISELEVSKSVSSVPEVSEIAVSEPEINKSTRSEHEISIYEKETRNSLVNTLADKNIENKDKKIEQNKKLENEKDIHILSMHSDSYSPSEKRLILPLKKRKKIEEKIHSASSPKSSIYDISVEKEMAAERKIISDKGAKDALSKMMEKKMSASLYTSSVQAESDLSDKDPELDKLNVPYREIECTDGEIYPALKPNISEFKIFSNKLMWKEYLEASVSIKMNTTCEWIRLKCFDSISLDDSKSSTFFTGGPVQSSAFCPIPSHMDQYVAVASSNKIYSTGRQNSLSYLDTKNEKGLIQFWNLGCLQSTRLNRLPCMEFALEHQHGIITEMKWCPKGCYDLPLSSDGVVGSRLGLLALSCSDSYIRVYCVPHPNILPKTNGNASIYTTSPTLVLTPLFSDPCSLTRRSIATCLDWHRNADVIAAGYGNGCICVWMVKIISASSATIVTVKNKDQSVSILPYLVFEASGTPITSISFAPLNNFQYLVSSSFDKTLKFFDLLDTSMPFCSIKRGFALNDCKWAKDFCGSLISLYDGIIFKGSTFAKECGTEEFPAQNIADTFGSITCSAISDIIDVQAIADITGTVSANFFYCSCDEIKQPSFDTYVLFETEIVCLDQDGRIPFDNVLNSEVSTVLENVVDVVELVMDKFAKYCEYNSSFNLHNVVTSNIVKVKKSMDFCYYEPELIDLMNNLLESVIAIGTSEMNTENTPVVLNLKKRRLDGSIENEEISSVSLIDSASDHVKEKIYFPIEELLNTTLPIPKEQLMYVDKNEEKFKIFEQLSRSSPSLTDVATRICNSVIEDSFSEISSHAASFVDIECNILLQNCVDSVCSNSQYWRGESKLQFIPEVHQCIESKSDCAVAPKILLKSVCNVMPLQHLESKSSAMQMSVESESTNVQPSAESESSVVQSTVELESSFVQPTAESESSVVQPLADSELRVVQSVADSASRVVDHSADSESIVVHTSANLKIVVVHPSAESEPTCAPPSAESEPTCAPLSAESEPTCAPLSAESEPTCVPLSTESEPTCVHLSAESERTCVHPSAESESTCVHPSAESESTCVHPSAESESTCVHPSAESESTCVHPSAESESTCVHPSAESESSGVYPSAESESSGVHPSAESKSTCIHPSAKSESSGVHASAESKSSGVHASAESESSGMHPSAESESTFVLPTAESDSTVVLPPAESESSDVEPLAESESTVVLSPTEVNSTVVLSPTEVNSTVELPPMESESTVVLPIMESESTVVLPPMESESTVVLPPMESESTVVLPPMESESTVVLPPMESESTVVLPPMESESTVVLPPMESESTVVLPPMESESTVVLPPMESESTVVLPPMESNSTIVLPPMESNSTIVLPPMKSNSTIVLPAMESNSTIVLPPMESNSTIVLPPMESNSTIVLPPMESNSAVVLPPMVSKSTVQPYAESESTVVQAKAESESTVVQAKAESESTVVQAKTESESTVVQAKAESESTVVQAKAESESTVVQAKAESESTVVQAKAESESTVVQPTTESESTVVQPTTESESIVVQRPAESESSVVQPPTESESSVVQPPTESESSVVQPPTESESSVVQPPTDSESSVVQLPTKSESSVVQPPTKSESSVVQPPTESKSTVVQPSVESESTVVQPPALSESSVVQPPTKSESSVVQPPTKSESSVVQPPTESKSTVVQPSVESESTVVQPPALSESSVVQPPTKSESSVVQPSVESESTVVQPPALSESSVVQPPTKSESSVVQPPTESKSTVVQPPALSESSVVQPTAETDSTVVQPQSAELEFTILEPSSQSQSINLQPSALSQSTVVHPCAKSDSTVALPSSKSEPSTVQQALEFEGSVVEQTVESKHNVAEQSLVLDPNILHVPIESKLNNVPQLPVVSGCSAVQQCANSEGSIVNSKSIKFSCHAALQLKSIADSSDISNHGEELNLSDDSFSMISECSYASDSCDSIPSFFSESVAPDTPSESPISIDDKEEFLSPVSPTSIENKVSLSELSNMPPDENCSNQPSKEKSVSKFESSVISTEEFKCNDMPITDNTENELKSCISNGENNLNHTHASDPQNFDSSSKPECFLDGDEKNDSGMPNCLSSNESDYMETINEESSDDSIHMMEVDTVEELASSDLFSKPQHLQTSRQFLENASVSEGTAEAYNSERRTKELLMEESPVSYTSLISTCGLVFNDVNKISTSSEEKKESLAIGSNILSSVNAISWNPNYGCHFWLVTGGNAGVARLICVSELGTQENISLLDKESIM
ncbi:uncharacterized protein LOC129960012 [Argiope bruennichi]|uniref:uncharacterized protein LOC129960012 n=1 Tax=Argiope bruennichi TaxID=94029 RepID=UPI0024952A2A|nr:uncharacterized protein LOC129960012 [Argiope bruennichi]